MSRSKKKHDYAGYYCASSDKEFKRTANRSFRRQSKMKITTDEEPPAHIRESSDIWNSAKDEKMYIGLLDKNDPLYFKQTRK